MQDIRYIELCEQLGINNQQGLEDRFKELLTNNEQDQEYLKKIKHELEPKYVIVKNGYRYEFRARYTDMHRSMLSSDEIRHWACDGGGFWGVDGEKKLVTLYDSSSDFGRPKHIEEAIKQNGWHLLEILGKECDPSGEVHDLSDYTISYIDAAHVRHNVKPPYDKAGEPGSDIRENAEGEYLERMKQQSLREYESYRPSSNYTPPSTINKKKRKAKKRQQRQARKRSRRHV